MYLKLARYYQKRGKEVHKYQVHLRNEEDDLSAMVENYSISEDRALVMLNPVFSIDRWEVQQVIDLGILPPYDQPIPGYGHLMTREEWLEDVKSGTFKDYDGMARPSNGKAISNQILYPSEASLIPTDATHVVWYNR